MMDVTLHEWFYGNASQGLFLGVGGGVGVTDQALLERAWDIASRMEAAFRDAGTWTEQVSSRHHFYAGMMLKVVCHGTHNYAPAQFGDVVRRAYELGSLQAATEDRAAGGAGVAPAFPAAQMPAVAQPQGNRATPIMLARPAPPAPAMTGATPIQPGAPVAGAAPIVVRGAQAQMIVTPTQEPAREIPPDWMDPQSENARKVTMFWREKIPDLPALLGPEASEKEQTGANRFRMQLIDMYKKENPDTWEKDYRAAIGQDPNNFVR